MGTAHHVQYELHKLTMEKFESKTLFTDAKGVFEGKVDKREFQDELNELGSQRWELVNAAATAQSYGSTRRIISVLNASCNKYRIIESITINRETSEIASQ